MTETNLPSPAVQTSPPLDVLMKAAHNTPPRRRPVEYYRDILSVLVLDKGMTAVDIKQWLEDHGAGRYPLLHVSPLVSRIRKEHKELQNDQPQ